MKPSETPFGKQSQYIFDSNRRTRVRPQSDPGPIPAEHRREIEEHQERLRERDEDDELL